MTGDQAADRQGWVIVGLVTFVLIALRLAAWALPAQFVPLRNQTIDQLFKLRSRVASVAPPYDPVVVHVDVDNRSLDELGTYYVTREMHAEFVRSLDRAGVAAQLQDYIFAAPQSEEPDAALERATRKAGNVYFGMALAPTSADETAEAPPPDPEQVPTLNRIRWTPDPASDLGSIPRANRYFLTFPRIANASRGLGFLDVEPDIDGVFRRLHLLVRDRDGVYPSMALRVAADYLGVTPDRILVRAGRDVTLRGALRPGEDTPRDIVIPVDDEGRMIVDFIGPWSRMTHYPMSVIYEAGQDRFAMMDLREELEGKIAVVGTVVTGGGDIGTVPTDPTYPLPGMHANAIHSILNGLFLRELTPFKTMLWIEIPLLLLLLGASLRLRTLPLLGVALLLIVGHVVTGSLAFLFGRLIVDIPGPTLSLIGSTILIVAYRYHIESRARAVLRSTFDAYFPPTVVDKIMAEGGELSAAASQKELTILFSDIKSFTHFTSSMSPDHVRDLLNEYFEAMIEIVFRYGGTLDKFIGDGLMVFFGDPQEQPDHATLCVRAAIDMQASARILNARWSERGDMPLEIRIGINTANVVVGNMGSVRRVSYTVLGEGVNLAQRLESSAPVGGILISQRTEELLDPSVPVLKRDPIRVKGIDRALEVFEVPCETVVRSPEGDSR